MDIGKFVRQSISNYLNNPIMLLPFAIMGLLTAGFGIFSRYYLHYNLQSLGIDLEATAFARFVPAPLLSILLNYAIIIVFSVLVISFISSFFHAFSIGLAEKIALKKKPVLADGFKAIKSGFYVFGFKILIWGFTVIGAILMALPAVFLYGIPGLLLACIGTVFLFILLQFVGFFGKQAIVLEKRNAWSGFQRSYHIIWKDLGNVLLLMVAYLFFLVGFVVFKRIFITIASYIIAGFGLIVFSQAADFIFTFLILSPLFVIIKTSFFLKKSNPRKARGA